MENRINKIIELADGNKYIIIKQAIYKSENYYVAVRLNDEETDIMNIEKPDEENLRVLHELVYEGNPSVEDVTDPDLFKLIIRYVGLEEE
jgi:negative regulator of genetic competence, sporulation and motility